MSDDDDIAVDDLLAGRLSDPTCVVLDGLRELAHLAPPAPSARLAELLAGGCTPAAVAERVAPTVGAGEPRRTDRTGALIASLPAAELSRRNRVGRLVAAAVLAGGVTAGLTGVAAAHDALPDPAQTVVRTVVNTITTFRIDRNRGHDASLPAAPDAAPVAAPAPPAGPVDDALAVPRRRRPGRSVVDVPPSVPPAPATTRPDALASSSAPPPPVRPRRAARPAVQYGGRAAGRVAQPHRVARHHRQRAHHHPHPVIPPVIRHLPITLVDLWAIVQPAAASRSSRTEPDPPVRSRPAHRTGPVRPADGPPAEQARPVRRSHAAASGRQRRHHGPARVVPSRSAGLPCDM